MPETLLVELLDFAEFLNQKKAPQMLLEIQGGLENSSTFAGDPVSIQKKVRA